MDQLRHRSAKIPGERLSLAIVLTGSFLLKLRNLGHASLTPWDESFHALVAKNLLLHWLKPTLIEIPYLPCSARDWISCHLWLTKPILPLWEVSLSFKLFGVTTWALRFPAVLETTVAALVTYLIGARLFDRRAGLVACALQAFAPSLMMIVQGYQFADTVDASLLLWVEVGIYFLIRAVEKGRAVDFLLSGAAQGLAFLSKSVLALLITGLAVFALGAGVGIGARKLRLVPRQMLLFVGGAVIVAAPWTVFKALAYPVEVRWTAQNVWNHVVSDVEGWAAPWHRIPVDYLPFLYGRFFAPFVTCLVVLIPRLRRKGFELWFTVAWLMGVLLPHSLVVTKTPTATLIALPAAFLLIGHVVSEGARDDDLLLGVWAASMFIALVFPAPGGRTSHAQVPVVTENWLWIVRHSLAGVLAGVLLARLLRSAAPAAAGPKYGRGRQALVSLAVFVSARLLLSVVRSAFLVTSLGSQQPAYADLTAATAQLPPNAVLIFDQGWQPAIHIQTMFRTGRTCYSFEPGSVDRGAALVRSRGGIPYLVTSHPRRGRPLFRLAESDLYVYEARRPPAGHSP